MKKKCQICGEEFEPKRFWQKICPKEECHRERARRNAQKWYSKNKEHRKKYMKGYLFL